MEPPLLMRQLRLQRLARGESLGPAVGGWRAWKLTSAIFDAGRSRKRAAELSADGYVRRIHLELSRQYEQRVAKLEAEVRRAQIHVVDAA